MHHKNVVVGISCKSTRYSIEYDIKRGKNKQGFEQMRYNKVNSQLQAATVITMKVS